MSAIKNIVNSKDSLQAHVHNISQVLYNNVRWDYVQLFQLQVISELGLTRIICSSHSRKYAHPAAYCAFSYILKCMCNKNTVSALHVNSSCNMARTDYAYIGTEFQEMCDLHCIKYSAVYPCIKVSVPPSVERERVQVKWQCGSDMTNLFLILITQKSIESIVGLPNCYNSTVTTYYYS